MNKYLSRFHPSFAASLVYMLQAGEYKLDDFYEWLHRAPDLRLKRVAKRKQLVLTAKAKLLLAAAYMLVLLCVGTVIGIAWLAATTGTYALFAGAIVVLLLMPLLIERLLVLPLILGEYFIQRPREKRIIAAAAQKLSGHKALRIAVAGSYGKTTFKETLAAVLGAGKNVAMTPGNKNTPLGISQFIRTLSGDEEVIIFELGEYYPGDVATLCQLVKPDIGIITGINEAHLSKFKTIDRTVATIFELADFLGEKPVYKNGENALVAERAGSADQLLYTAKGVNGWKVSGASSSLDGTTFTASKGEVRIAAHAGLLGDYQVGPLVACIDIAERLGLSPDQITQGLAAVVPFEHRMQPRTFHGAWLIDDTYNGNIDGVKAGIAFLANCKATRRIYVTPGLVEQGKETQRVHEEIGRLLAGSADVVVLMKNSVTGYIQKGLSDAGFMGTVKVVENPVSFYANLEHFVAVGDVVLMQNDWTDNYN